MALFLRPKLDRRGRHLSVVFIVAVAQWGVQAAVLSKQLDDELVALHASLEENWERAVNISGQLNSALSNAALGEASVGVGQSSYSESSRQKLETLRKLRIEFESTQQVAFQIGKESKDNVALSAHPGLNDYLHSLRGFRPRLESAIADIEREYERVTGVAIEKPKNTRKTKKSSRGLSASDVRKRVRSAISKDDRPYRAQAMDAISSFRERQLQMQDKQGDLKLAMDGPDWPAEDWPLNAADAKTVGEAETLIQDAIEKLTVKLDAVGGLGRAHESGDAYFLEQISMTSELISAYCDLIDSYVATVKRLRTKQTKATKRKRATASTESADSGRAAGSLREHLLQFGGSAFSGFAGAAPSSQPSQPHARPAPFAWLRENDGAIRDQFALPGNSGFGGASSFVPVNGASSSGSLASFGLPGLGIGGTSGPFAGTLGEFATAGSGVPVSSMTARLGEL